MKKITRASAIKLYCKMSCSAGDMNSWKNCPSPECFLWRFRLGRELSDKEPRCAKKTRVLSLQFSKNDKLEPSSEVQEVLNANP